MLKDAAHNSIERKMPRVTNRPSAESAIAGTVASLRHTRKSAYEIAQMIVRDLEYFGYHIQPNFADKETTRDAEER
jgi:hypothetical protein